MATPPLPRPFPGSKTLERSCNKPAKIQIVVRAWERCLQRRGCFRGRKGRKCKGGEKTPARLEFQGRRVALVFPDPTPTIREGIFADVCRIVLSRAAPVL